MIQTFKIWATTVALISITTSFGQDSTLAPDSLVVSDSLLMQTHQPISEASWLVQALVIDSGEDADIRWITVSHTQKAGKANLQYPIIETDANAGSFSLQIGGVDTNAYLGSQMLRDHGHFPIHYQVEYPDSQAIKIVGKTLPYDDLKFFYSFTESQYRFEFIFEKSTSQLQSAPHVTITPNSSENVSGTLDEPLSMNRDILKNKGTEFKSMLLNSVYLGAVALGLTLLIFALIIWFKRRSNRKELPGNNFSEMLDTKVDMPSEENNSEADEPIILTPEAREEKIRGLMESGKLSYDEAALRIQYEQMNK